MVGGKISDSKFQTANNTLYITGLHTNTIVEMSAPERAL